MVRTPNAVALVAMLLLAACSGQPEQAQAPAEDVVVEGAWKTVAVEELTEDQLAQQQRSLEAIQAMGGRLMGELTTALDEDGPEGAIEICSHRAPEISAMIANEYGLVLGRTSHRLRNPSNMAPEWAEPLIETGVMEPTWLVGPDGRFAGLVPIRARAECAICHGPREEIAPEVLAKLDDFYPDDAAVGFAEGDLRGWFWVESPPG